MAGAVRVVLDDGRTTGWREEVCEREQVPERSNIATGGPTSGPITSSYSRIKSRIVIPYSSVYHNTIHRRWILTNVSHYSGRIIILLCESAARDRDPAFVYPFFLSALLFVLSFYLPRLSRSNKWKHLDLASSSQENRDRPVEVIAVQCSKEGYVSKNLLSERLEFMKRPRSNCNFFKNALAVGFIRIYESLNIDFSVNYNN